MDDYISSQRSISISKKAGIVLHRYFSNDSIGSSIVSLS